MGLFDYTKYTLIDALSANNSSYLKSMANGDTFTFNNTPSIEINNIKIYLYPDIYRYVATIGGVNVNGRTSPMVTGTVQYNSCTSFKIEYRENDGSTWFPYDGLTGVVNTDVSFVMARDISLMDTTPNPTEIEVKFSEKKDWVVRVTKLEEDVSSSFLVETYHQQIRDWYFAEVFGEDGAEEGNWHLREAAKATPLTAANLVYNNYKLLGGVLGVKTTKDYKNFYSSHRLGLNNQQRLPGFSGLSRYTPYSGQKITTGSPKIHQTNEPIDGVRLKLMSPALYRADDEGDIGESSVTFNLLYRKTGSSTWVTANNPATGTTDYIITGKSTSSFDAFLVLNFPERAAYDVQISRITADSTDVKTQNDFYLAGVLENEHTDIAYINTAVLGVVAKATNNLSGATPTVTVILNGRVLRDVRDVRTSGPGVIEKFSRNPANFVADLVVNKRYGAGRFFTYENLDFKSLCDFADFCDEMVKKSIKLGDVSAHNLDTRYVAGQYVEAYSNIYKCIKTFDDAVNPATAPVSNPEYWALLPVDGNGVTYDMQKRFELDIVFDQKYVLSDIIKKICETCRTSVYWKGTKIAFFVDKPGIPKQSFSMGNIKKGSFSESYVSSFSVANQMEATFFDEEDDYKNATMIVIDKESQFTRQEDVRSATVQLIGLTDRWRVRRELQFAIRKAKAVCRSINFTTNMSALISEVGDLIWFQHRTPFYGTGGHITKAYANYIELDQPFENVSGESYRIRIQRRDKEPADTFYLHNFTGTGEPIAGFTIYGHDALVGDTYQVGLVGKEAKPFRITLLKKKNTQVEVQAEEYVESVYDDSAGTDIEVLNYSGFGNRPLGSNYIPNVTEISLVESVVSTGSTTTSNINVSFYPITIFKKTAETVKHYEVYTKTPNTPWVMNGTTSVGNFVIPNAVKGESYYVCVRIRTNTGKTGFLSNDWFIQDIFKITITGETDCVYENGVYEPGIFATTMQQNSAGMKLHTTLWLQEPISVAGSFTDI